MSHSCSAFPATREKADSIPNRGTFSHSPRSSSQSYHLLTQNKFENRTGITKTVLEKAEPPPRCSQTGRENPQCSYKSAESSKKGPVFPLLTDTQPPARSTTTAQALVLALALALPPRPERQAHCQGRASIMHRTRTPYGHYCSPRACERRATQTTRFAASARKPIIQS
jgi:hypothetical protein